MIDYDTLPPLDPTLCHAANRLSRIQIHLPDNTRSTNNQHHSTQPLPLSKSLQNIQTSQTFNPHAMRQLSRPNTETHNQLFVSMYSKTPRPRPDVSISPYTRTHQSATTYQAIAAKLKRNDTDTRILLKLFNGQKQLDTKHCLQILMQRARKSRKASERGENDPDESMYIKYSHLKPADMIYSNDAVFATRTPARVITYLLTYHLSLQTRQSCTFSTYSDLPLPTRSLKSTPQLPTPNRCLLRSRGSRSLRACLFFNLACTR